MSYWTIAWIVWLGIFLVIEGLALANKKPGDTLSETVWDWFAVKRKRRLWRIRRIVLAGFMLWLAVHFLTGGWM